MTDTSALTREIETLRVCAIKQDGRFWTMPNCRLTLSAEFVRRLCDLALAGLKTTSLDELQRLGQEWDAAPTPTRSPREDMRIEISIDDPYHLIPRLVVRLLEDEAEGAVIVSESFIEITDIVKVLKPWLPSGG